MKKLFLFAGIAVFGLLCINAQSNPTSDGIKFGAKAGVNFATLTGDTEDVKSRTAFHFGVVVEIPVSDKFSVQPELLYSAQGAKDDLSDDVLKLDYLTIPIMAKLYVAEGFSLELGPQVGFLLSAKEEFDGESEDIKDFVKGTDFGVNFGLGYQLETGLNFGARYNLGLSDLNDFESSDSIKNGVFQITIGYFF